MDRQNFSYGGEIPKLLGKALFSNENALNSFVNLSSCDKQKYIVNSKKMKSFPEIRSYVDTDGESYIDTKDYVPEMSSGQNQQ